MCAGDLRRKTGGLPQALAGGRQCATELALMLPQRRRCTLLPTQRLLVTQADQQQACIAQHSPPLELLHIEAYSGSHIDHLLAPWLHLSPNARAGVVSADKQAHSKLCPGWLSSMSSP